jgi:hypothetical protein
LNFSEKLSRSLVSGVAEVVNNSILKKVFTNVSSFDSSAEFSAASAIRITCCRFRKEKKISDTTHDAIESQGNQIGSTYSLINFMVSSSQLGGRY